MFRMFSEFFAMNAGNSFFNFQKPASLVMEKVFDFHNVLLLLIFSIVIFVLCLLIYTVFRFHESRNKVPSKTTHNNTLEIIWAVIPLMVITVIAFRSVNVLKFMNIVPPKTEMTLKVVGHQWYWTYEYPESGVNFDSYMKKDEELKEGDFRLLSTDNPIYLPINTNIKIQITADDVIHSWAVPAFGIKTDAVPGRLNETWVNIVREGRYFGQCSELCGILHGFMPIEIVAVDKVEFEQWLKEKAES